MSTRYYLKIGGSELFPSTLEADLAATDEKTKARAEALLNDQLKETRVRIGTLLKTDNVSFLIGAGASIDAGGVGLGAIPTSLELALCNSSFEDNEHEWIELFYSTASLLSKQVLEIDDRREVLDDRNQRISPIPLNLEVYLSQLHTWRAACLTERLDVSLGDDNWIIITPDALDRLIREVTIALTHLVKLPSAGKEGALKTQRRFIKKILTRPLNLRRANLFTLNYDTLLEQAADGEGAVLVDGFVGTLRRVFRPESYDLDFYFPAQTTEGRVHRFDRALHLYKLHGSLNWHRCEADWENPYGLYATYYDQRVAQDDVLIYPSPLKYGQALGLPYSELFRRLGTAIAQPQSVLFVIGYGFGDDHVNALIRQALAIPSFTLVVVDPSPASPFVGKLKELGDERVWMISGWELGTFAHFVEKLLPDLREEDITSKVMKTYRSLEGPKLREARTEEDDDDA
jgi:hypothetical protein